MWERVGLNVCGVCVGGGRQGSNSALIQYCICSFPVIAPKYFIVFLFNTVVNKVYGWFLGSVDGQIYKQTEKHADRQVSPDYSTGSIRVPYGQKFT